MTPNEIQREANKIFGKNLLVEIKDGKTLYRYITDTPSGLPNGYFVRHIFTMSIEDEKITVTWYNCNTNVVEYGCTLKYTLETMVSELQRFARKLTNQKDTTVTPDDLSRCAVQNLTLSEFTQVAVQGVYGILVSGGGLPTVVENALNYLGEGKTYDEMEGSENPEKVNRAIAVIARIGKTIGNFRG